MAKTKILILTSSTGGGHDMRARSLKAWMELPENAAYGECRIHQALEETHALYRFGVGLYNWIQKTSPRLHHIYYNVIELLGATGFRKSVLGREKFMAILREFKPDIVVSTHDQLNHAFFALARETLGRDRVRCVTYCGELFGGYGFARGWVNPEADAFIGAVDACCDAARALKMPEAKLHLGGFLLDPTFFQPPASDEKASLFAELDLDPARFTLLLGTGANGANNHRACIEACDRAGLSVQFIALCGRNERTRRELENLHLKTAGSTIRALGYTRDMPRLLRSVSAVFARPGTGTTSEAIVCRCPILFNGIGGIMPQELITVRFARERGFFLGTAPTPARFAAAIRDLQNPDRLRAARDCIRKINTKLTPQHILYILATRKLRLAKS